MTVAISRVDPGPDWHVSVAYVITGESLIPSSEREKAGNDDDERVQPRGPLRKLTANLENAKIFLNNLKKSFENAFSLQLESENTTRRDPSRVEVRYSCV